MALAILVSIVGGLFMLRQIIRVRSGASALLWFAATGLLIAGCWIYSPVMTPRARPSLWLAIDVSKSMLVRNGSASRLADVKAGLLDLPFETQEASFGLVAFAKKTRLLCPPTRDAAALRAAIRELSVASAPAGGTRLDDPLRWLEEAETPFPVGMILVSDGGHEPLDFREALRNAAQAHCPVFGVGVGSTDGPKALRRNDAVLGDIAATYNGRLLQLAALGDQLPSVVQQVQHASLPAPLRWPWLAAFAIAALATQRTRGI